VRIDLPIAPPVHKNFSTTWRESKIVPVKKIGEWAGKMRQLAPLITIKCRAANAGNNTFLFLLSDFSVSGRQGSFIRNKDHQRVY
jgi:hypothetical protein